MGICRAFIAAGAAILVVAGFAGCSDSGETITLILHEPGHEVGVYAAIGEYTASRYEPGTGYTFAVPLQRLSAAGKYPPQEIVGEMFVACLAGEPTSLSGEPLHGQCTGTVIAPGGTLALSVGGDVGDKASGAIVGGTGKYAGASGTFTWVGKFERTDTFHITLP